MFLAWLLPLGAWAGSEKVLYNFGGGSDGANPYDTGLLVRDRDGNFYGTTYQGGACGDGTVFELSNGGQETVLHSFCLGKDGGFPFGGVILDPAGNVYGTTEVGGPLNGGTVFEMVRQANGQWKERVLHSFSGSDGKGPFNGLIRDAAGNLYGVASEGGSEAAFGGVVFEISRSGTYNVLYNFCSQHDCVDGQLPVGGLAMDKSGSLYGITGQGGMHSKGAVFKLSKSSGAWKETVLHSFAGGNGDGAYPLYGGPTLAMRTVQGKKRLVIFGVTTLGGSKDKGTAFEIVESTSDHKFSVLHNFGTGRDGALPYGTLISVKGRLYGTTGFRGNSCCGTVFELTEKNHIWEETVIYSFRGGEDGGYPYSGVEVDANGNLFGVANTGGSGKSGVVFEVEP
jgi:uncharacterized repeat protein (TIGR03803 family)